ncbi:MAG TPA: hypothetical protein VIW47_15395, partial [Nitrospiraceae bacterium]
GMDDYMSKPVQSSVLAEVLSRWIGTSASRPHSTGAARRRPHRQGAPCEGPMKGKQVIEPTDHAVHDRSREFEAGRSSEKPY